MPGVRLRCDRGRDPPGAATPSLDSKPAKAISWTGSAAQKRAYDRAQKFCARKYRSEDGAMYRSFEAFRGAHVARDYSARFLKAASQPRK
jgi:hypothetical protein